MMSIRTVQKMNYNFDRFIDALKEQYQIKVILEKLTCEPVTLSIDEIDQDLMPMELLPKEAEWIYIDYYLYEHNKIPIVGIFILNNDTFILSYNNQKPLLISKGD